MKVSASPEIDRRVSVGAQSEASLLGFDDEVGMQRQVMRAKRKTMSAVYVSMKGVSPSKVNCCSLIDLDTFS